MCSVHWTRDAAVQQFLDTWQHSIRSRAQDIGPSQTQSYMHVCVFNCISSLLKEENGLVYIVISPLF